ncbi:MAG: glycosyltransferase [Planctomycetes bacterium]|nr:glycosyltransferase [Planctomycetota bacterium]
MDHHAGFSTNSPELEALEARLIEDADLVITSSQKLSETIGLKRENHLIRNAAEVEFFKERPRELKLDKEKPVVGYYGAISDWFDIELVVKAAKAFPEWDFVLIGHVFMCDISKAKKCKNIRFIDEVPYADLPGYLYAFDVCMIPFLITELTLATNPVKIYEYLSAGKPVVATAMPELIRISDQMHVADSHDTFLEALKSAMEEAGRSDLAKKRSNWANQRNWTSRARDLHQKIQTLFPKVSIIVLTFNQLEFTRACLHSLLKFTRYPNWELIVVDNASTDGTTDFLADFSSNNRQVKLILNESNLGFAAGNNVGLKAAGGEYLVLLNNDTFVTEGWLIDLLRHLRNHQDLGLVGPVTNNIGNEAKINITYADMADMRELAYRYTSSHLRELLHVNSIALFCAAMRRKTFEEIGSLDEAFNVGFFEDDDFCNRLRKAGYKIAIAEDVFVHHHLSASFNDLGQKTRNEIFEKNKKIYEEKWGPWTPHKYRD